MKAIKKILIAIIVLFVFALYSSGIFFIGVMFGVDQTPPAKYTGQEIFNAVNEYRKSKNLSTLTIDEELCNDIVSRYLFLTSEEARKEGHPAFKEYTQAKWDKGYAKIAENFSDRPSVEEVITGWQSSPGHNLALNDPLFDLGCSYADRKGTVVIFGTKQIPEGYTETN